MIPHPRDVPVEPTPPEAAEWLVEELSKTEYREAQPTIVDRAAEAFLDWISSLTSSGIGGVPWLALGILAVLLLLVIVVIAVLLGRPRRNRRSRQSPGGVFADDDARSPTELRRDAEEAARRQDWVAAIRDRFRAMARDLADRDLVAVLPGTTAREFARDAGESFPAETQPLRDAADVFDDVRYLSLPGDEARYRSLAALDQRLASARPVLASAAKNDAEVPR